MIDSKKEITDQFLPFLPPAILFPSEISTRKRAQLDLTNRSSVAQTKIGAEIMNFRPPDHRFAHVSLSANAAKENQSYQFRAGRYAIRSTEKLFIYDFRGKGREEEEGKRNYKFPAKRCVFFSLLATEGMLTKITLRATINVSRGSMKRRSRSLRRKRRAQGKRGAFRSRPSSLKKKKKRRGQPTPVSTLLTSLDLRARSEGPSPLSLESINVALQRGPVYPVKPTPFSLS